MAQLYFRYGAMNASKSMQLMAIAHNYEEKGDRVRIFLPSIDVRAGIGKIKSRIGLERDAEVVYENTDLFKVISEDREGVACILVDEGQFLNRDHVLQLCRVVDMLEIPVIVFGLKTDFQARLFPGSEALLCLADKIEELKTVCWKCGRKASYNMRIDALGNKVTEGSQILIGGNDSYMPVCRKHFLY
jgi:thymidine kinase